MIAAAEQPRMLRQLQQLESGPRSVPYGPGAGVKGVPTLIHRRTVAREFQPLNESLHICSGGSCLKPVAGESSFVRTSRSKPTASGCAGLVNRGPASLVEANGERTKLTVRFDRAGFKKLIARFAELQRLG